MNVEKLLGWIEEDICQRRPDLLQGLAEAKRWKNEHPRPRKSLRKKLQASMQQLMTDITYMNGLIDGNLKLARLKNHAEVSNERAKSATTSASVSNSLPSHSPAPAAEATNEAQNLQPAEVAYGISAPLLTRSSVSTVKSRHLATDPKQASTASESATTSASASH